MQILNTDDRGILFHCSKKSKIAALEAKLKLLEENNLTVALTPDVGAGATKPTSVTYAFIERKPGTKTQASGTATSTTTAPSTSSSSFRKSSSSASHPYRRPRLAKKH